MNIRQRRILIIVAVAVTGMLLYPPLITVGIPTWGGDRNPGTTYSYDWLWADPFSGVNFALLFTQFFVLGVVASIAFVLNPDQKKSN